eukprot:3205017-Amphidinium_carterae.1
MSDSYFHKLTGFQVTPTKRTQPNWQNKEAEPSSKPAEPSQHTQASRAKQHPCVLQGCDLALYI